MKKMILVTIAVLGTCSASFASNAKEECINATMNLAEAAYENGIAAAEYKATGKKLIDSDDSSLTTEQIAKLIHDSLKASDKEAMTGGEVMAAHRQVQAACVNKIK